MLYSPDFWTLGLTPEDVLREMGYRKVVPGDETVSSVHSVFSEVGRTAKPCCVFRIFDGGIDGTAVRLGNGTELHPGDILTRLLSGSSRFAVFAATAGADFQKLQKKIAGENDMLRVFILDVIGSCVAERTGDAMEILLEKEIGGDRHTHRFSPGYCGWPLMEQRLLFSLLDGEDCGIGLSESCLMNPIKSISGIVGIGETVNEKQYGCRLCEQESCYKRKNKKQRI